MLDQPKRAFLIYIKIVDTALSVSWLTARIWLKARFCCAKSAKGRFASRLLCKMWFYCRLPPGFLKSKAVSPRLLSQADGRVTFVWETKVTKNSFKSARLGRRTDGQWGLNGDNAVAFVMARSHFDEGFGNCRVSHSSGLQTSLTRQGPGLPANPPGQRLVRLSND